MKKIIKSFSKPLILVSLIFQSACFTSSVDVKPVAGAPFYARTEASKVALLRTTPSRPYTKLAEIVIRPGSRITDIKLNNRLKDEGAELGADAVLITSDKHYAVASAPRGGFANTYEQYGSNVRVVKAFAIRYGG